MKLRLTFLAVLAAAFAAPALGAPTFVINGDSNIGGFALARNASLKAAIAAYGTPTSRETFGYDSCTVVWRELGIRIRFWHTFDDGCGLPGCHSETTITGPQWRTARGLKMGDPLRRLRKLHPRSKRYVGKNWMLISRRLGGVRLPTLLATIEGGRISAFLVRSPWLLIC